MARTSQMVHLKPSASGERPTPIPLTSGGFSADIGLVIATHLDDVSVILLPGEYIHDPVDYPDAQWREYGSAGWCWRTTVIYEQIGENHPHLVPFLRRDPWNAFPILARPSGTTLGKFIAKHRATMYSAPLDALSSRIVAAFRPQIYQWALHLISALAFVHKHDVVFSDFGLDHCWLSAEPDLTLSLVGFVTAGYKNKAWGGHEYFGEVPCVENFHPLEFQDTPPTKQTDLFLFGRLVYYLMTGDWPGNRMGRSGDELAAMVKRGQWPPLELEYMGEIVHKCWAGEFASANEVQSEVEAFIEKVE